MDLPLKLASLRKEKGLTQIDLAEQLNVSRQAISKWEVGTAIPGTDKLKALSELYGVPVDYLLNDELNAPPAIPANPTQVPNYPSINLDSKKDKQRFALVLILAVVITTIISIAACVAVIHFEKQNRPVPMEDMPTNTSIHSDEIFSFG